MVPGTARTQEGDPRFREPLIRRPAAREATPDEPWQALIDSAREIPQLRALVVSSGGRLELAERFDDRPLDEPANVKSVSKTLVALLTGIAIDAGVIPSVGSTLGDIAPTLIPANAEPVVRRITVGHLLSMQAGLERTSGPAYGEWVSSEDWVADALARPQIAPLGERMLYSTGSYHVLAAVLEQRSGRSLLELARSGLGEPLGIDFPPWTRDPQGRYLGGNEMSVSPVGLARIGQAVAANGRYRGQRIVSAAWIRQSWQTRTRSPYSGHDYGYGWFLARVGREFLAYARGYGGQVLYVMPERDLVVVMLCDPTRPARSGSSMDVLHDLFANRIVPAVS